MQRWRSPGAGGETHTGPQGTRGGLGRRATGDDGDGGPPRGPAPSGFPWTRLNPLFLVRVFGPPVGGFNKDKNINGGSADGKREKRPRALGERWRQDSRTKGFLVGERGIRSGPTRESPGPTNRLAAPGFVASWCCFCLPLRHATTNPRPLLSGASKERRRQKEGKESCSHPLHRLQESRTRIIPGTGFSRPLASRLFRPSCLPLAPVATNKHSNK